MRRMRLVKTIKCAFYNSIALWVVMDVCFRKLQDVMVVTESLLDFWLMIH